MALLRNTTDQIKALLGNMTFSQKMLIGALLVIIAGSVAWMMNYAGKPELVAVINQQFEPAMLARQAAALKAAGIKSQVKDGKVVVAQGDQEQALAVLAFNGELAGQDISFGFQQVVNDSNIWRSESEKDRMWKVATENELARVMKLFPDVQDAKVIVDRPDKLTFGRKSDALGSAAVHLRLKAGAGIDKKMITAVADLVSGAVREVPRDRVKLIDTTNGRSYRVPSEDASIPADLLELTMMHEKHLSDNIVKAIGHIENVLISVSVKVDASGKTVKAVTPDKTKTITPVSEEHSSKIVSADGGGTGGEPGVRTNTGSAVTAVPGSGGGSGHTETDDKTVFGPPVVATTETMTTELPGAVKEVSAAVNVPRSYFVAALKASAGGGQPGGGGEPDPAALKQFMAEQTDQIKENVLRALGLSKADEARVAIGWYYDTPPVAATEAPGAPTAGVMALVAGHAGTIGLGTLAVVSILALLLMMRKAASGATIAAAAPQVGPAAVPSLGLVGGDGVVGEAGMADGSLPGVEVDAETLRAQKMVEQVASMVKGNPDAAASLVKRWITKKK